MSIEVSLDRIRELYEPMVSEADQRIAEGAGEDLDTRITQLWDRLGGSAAVGSRLVRLETTLADLRTAYLLHPEGASLIIDNLGLRAWFDQLEERLGASLFERFVTSSTRVLESLAVANLAYDKERFWVALASDEDLLCQQVDLLGEIRFSGAILACRAEEIARRQEVALGRKFHQSGDLFSWLFGRPELTLGELMVMRSDELTAVGNHLPRELWRVLSDEQIIGLDFSQVKGGLLDEIIAGDDAPEEHRRRLALLNPVQLKYYLRVTSGAYLRFLSDERIRQLPFSRLSAEQLREMFGLSRSQGLMTREGIEEARRLASLVPLEEINALLKKVQEPFLYFSPQQYAVVDPALLERSVVRKFFPGVTPETHHSASSLVLERQQEDILYFSKLDGYGGVVTRSAHLKQVLRENRELCLERANYFRHEQLEAMAHHLFPEVRKLLLVNIKNKREESF